MLKSLSINNYAIINELEIEFSGGLNIITGETGAGKSILLGALSLILGHRADTSVLKNNDKKCMVEGVFNIKEFNLQWFFEQNDLDYDAQTIIRREIGVNGKSRAFINDLPVNLNILKDLGVNLIDIHSQHENLNLHDNEFQLKVVDIIADNRSLLNTYQSELATYKKLIRELEVLKENIEKLKGDKEYFEFQFNELDKAQLKNDELSELEEEYKALSHAEELKQLLLNCNQILSNNDINVIASLKEVSACLQKVKTLLPSSAPLFERIESAYIELKDIDQEVDQFNEKTILDPERLEQVNARLNLIYSLQQKHQVKSVDELIEKRNAFKEKLDHIFFSDDKINILGEDIKKTVEKLNHIALDITKSRQNVIPSIEFEVNRLLTDLGMPHSKFKIQLEKKPEYMESGVDVIKFLYSPGNDLAFQNLAKIASGGEISRLMLSIKSLITRFTNLPTIIFDEIDTGVSGEIADKMGNIIKKMSDDMQVINITHLPQVASKGDYHYLVQKTSENNVTETRMKLLSNDERVTEVAKMLSGADLTEAAIQNARELLKY